MSGSIQQEKEKIILSLELVKKRLLKCKHFEDLVREIDNSLQLIYDVSDNTLTSHNEVLMRLQPSINHLKDMRSHILESKPRSTIDYGHEINLGIGMVQFELWDFEKEKLYNLLDSVA